MALDKQVADRVDQMQSQFLQMQEAFHTLKSSFQDSRMEQNEDNQQQLHKQINSNVEAIVQREVQDVQS